MHIDSGSKQDADINLAPIIDCMVVIVAFLLASSSFIAIGLMDAGVAAGVPAPNAAPPSVVVTVELKSNQTIVVKADGKQNMKSEIGSEDGKWNFSKLSEQLEGLKKSHSDLTGVTLVADETVNYEDVVQNMDTIRKTIPAVLLGGF